MGYEDEDDIEEKPSNGVGRSYRGTSLIARTSPWFTWEDIVATTGDLDKPLAVTVEDVIERKDMVFAKGRKRDIGIALKFKGHKRELLLNTTNRRTLCNLFNTDKVDPWLGATLEVFVQQGVKRGRERVNAVRFSKRIVAKAGDKASTPPVAPKQPDPTTPPVEPAPPSHGAPTGADDPDVWRRDVLANLAEFRNVAPAPEFDAVKVKAGIAGKTPAQLTAEDIDRINDALPAPFRLVF